MKFRTIPALLFLLFLAPAARSQEMDDIFMKDKIIEQMRRVASYQLEHPYKESDQNWIRATYYTGVMGLYRATGDERYLDQAIRWSEKFNWAEGTEREVANRKTCGQTYLELYFIDTQPERIEKMRSYVDSRMKTIADGELPTRGWYYADTLYVGPPTIAMLGRATGDPKYYDYMNKVFFAVADMLYDREDHLFYRDKRFIGQKTAAGRKIFWARGNGWVLGGLARILKYLPKENECYDRYVKLFREMAASIASRQGEDGLWRSNLDDPTQCPNPETSSSAFFCFAMAWGINNNLLDRETYEPIVKNAWRGLVRYVREDGKLGFVQPVGAEPKLATLGMTHEYAMGLFLLSGEEMIKLVESNAK